VRYVITGGAGYIGSRLVDFLSRREDTEKIVICDVASPQSYVPKTEFEHADVRDREAIRATLERAQPDALVHLASILNPSHRLEPSVHEPGDLRDHDARARQAPARGPSGRRAGRCYAAERLA
jgi:nucleoside-diphosphate-sugar epimerase